MKVSVVMSVYNAASYVGESILSILNQSFVDFEFIVVDDGSTDGSLKIIESFDDPRLSIISQPNLGLAKALNKAISVSNFDYIARMDADDIAASQRLEQQVAFLKNHPHTILLGTNAEVTDAEGNFLYHSTLPLTAQEIKLQLQDNPFFHSSVLFQKQAFLKAGGYGDEFVHHFEDKLLWFKMASFGDFANLPESLISYRLTPESITNKSKRAFQLQRMIFNKLAAGQIVSPQLKDEFNQSLNLSKLQKQSLYHSKISDILRSQKQHRKAFNHALASIRLNSTNLSGWKNLLLSCVKH